MTAITVPGRAGNPRVPVEAPPDIVIHHVPSLDPRDVTVVDGIPTTTVARTLIDLAETAAIEELRPIWHGAFARRLVTIAEIQSSLERVEWRPSLPAVQQLLIEFDA